MSKTESVITAAARIVDGMGRRGTPAHCSREMGADLFPHIAPAAFKWEPGENDSRAPEALDFVEDYNVREVGRALLAAYSHLFRHLDGRRILWGWRLAGGQSNGRPNVAGCTKAAPMIRALTAAGGAGPVDFVIWLAWDAFFKRPMTRYETEAALFHELLHTDINAKGQPALVGHDFEAFKREVAEYGDWRADLQGARDAFLQAPLFQDDGPGGGQ